MKGLPLVLQADQLKNVGEDMVKYKSEEPNFLRMIAFDKPVNTGYIPTACVAQFIV